jgi:23S rRNA pseudouridine2605 synthase
VCSRRKAETLIQEGRVTINGSTVTQLGSKADAEKDSIKIDGRRIRVAANKVYLLLNKPKGYICTLSDPEGRPLVTNLLRGISEKVFPVGRLDLQSEGLLLLTNDGEFSNLVSRAGQHCPKTYLAKLQGTPGPEAIERLAKGIVVDGKKLAPVKITLVKEGGNPWFRVTLIEGKNNQIRKMFEAIGHRVAKLKRIQIGFLSDPHLALGCFRTLTPGEIEKFKRLRQKLPD